MRIFIAGSYWSAVQTIKDKTEWKITSNAGRFIDSDGEQVLLVSRPEQMMGFVRGTGVYIEHGVTDREDFYKMQEIIIVRDYEILGYL